MVIHSFFVEYLIGTGIDLFENPINQSSQLVEIRMDVRQSFIEIFNINIDARILLQHF